jgi:hypothetical protein
MGKKGENQCCGSGSGSVGYLFLDLSDPDPSIFWTIRIRIQILPSTSKKGVRKTYLDFYTFVTSF